MNWLLEDKFRPGFFWSPYGWATIRHAVRFPLEDDANSYGAALKVPDFKAVKRNIDDDLAPGVQTNYDPFGVKA